MTDARDGHDGDGMILVALTALWALPIMLIGVHGEFPLNDDWAYARTTQTFLELGRFERDVWTYAPIFTNVGLGVVFAWIFGFSFEALRLSSVCMGWLGLVGSYLLFREVGVRPARSCFGAAAFGFNPVYLNLSYTFMTDVPFTALCIWSLLFCIRGLKRASWPALAAGMALALAATFSRQLGLAIAPAVVLAASVAPDSPQRRWLLRWGLLALAAVGAALAGAVALGGSASLRIPEFVRASSNDPSLARGVARNGLVAFVNLGLYLSPVVALALSRGAGFTRRAAVWSAAAATFVLGALVSAGRHLPIGGNVLYDLGVGPYTIRGAGYLPGAPEGFWWLVTGIAVSAGTSAVAMGATQLARSRFAGQSDRLLLLGFTVLYLVPLLVVDNFFDRYLLPAVAPLAAVLLAQDGGLARMRARRLAIALPLLAALTLFGVLGTHDYLERNRARWSLLAPLIAAGVSPERVDAGFEFEGWSGLHPAQVWERRRSGKREDFIVSHLDPRHLKHFRAIGARRYLRLLPPGDEGIALYQRSEPERAAP